MPSPKTAEKPKEPELIEVIAVRKFAVDYTKEELKVLESDDKQGRSMAGMTRMIDIGKSAFISKQTAKTLQDCGAVKIKL